jgi:hypothetical protein
VTNLQASTFFQHELILHKMLSKRIHCFCYKIIRQVTKVNEAALPASDHKASPSVNRNGTKCNRPNLTIHTHTAFLVPRWAISGPHNIPYDVRFLTTQTSTRDIVTWRIALQHKRHKAIWLTTSLRVPVHTKMQVADLRVNLSPTNNSLLVNNTITHAYSSSFCTNTQSNNVEPHHNISHLLTHPNNWLVLLRVICFSTGGCTGPPTYGTQIPPTPRLRPRCLRNTDSYWHV